MANSTAGWMDNMSELGSENMSTASLSLAGTLKARKKMSLINKYLGKRGFDDLGVRISLNGLLELSRALEAILRPFLN